MPIARKYARIIPRQSRGLTLSRLILEKIGEAGVALLDSFFPQTYPQAQLWRELLGLDQTYQFKRRTFTALLAKSKAHGLVVRVARGGKRYWRITARGRSVVSTRNTIPLPRPDGRKRLVCFDIPEYERAKRRWLRSELLACGYRQLQKSVWIGEVPLPQDFIEALDALELRSRIRFFGIASDGIDSEEIRGK